MVNNNHFKGHIRFPFHICISGLFILLLTITCGLQILFTQNGLSKVLLDANDHLFEHISGKIHTTLSYHFHPAFSSMEALAVGNFVGDKDLEARLSMGREVMTVLATNPRILAYTLIYPDGDYFQVYQVSDVRLRNALSSGPNSHFVIFNYSKKKQELSRLYFDSTHKLLNTETDTIRSKYIRSKIELQNSTKKVVTLSDPYFSHNVERTVITASKITSNGSIIAFDIALNQISEVLSESVIHPSSLRVLFDAKGKVYGYSQPEAIKLRDVNGITTPFLIGDIENKVVSKAISAIGKDFEESTEFEALGEKWFGKISVSYRENGHDLYLLMVVQTSELLEKSQIIADNAILASFLVLTIAILFVYLISQNIAKPIRRATQRAQNISNFDFSMQGQCNTYIQEIYELSNSLNNTQNTINRFLTLTHNISKEEDLEVLFKLVCVDALQATEAHSCHIYLEDNQAKLVPHYILSTTDGIIDPNSLNLIDLDQVTNNKWQNFAKQFLEVNEPLFLQYSETKQFLPDMKRNETFMLFPLYDRRDQLLGGFGLMLDKNNMSHLMHKNVTYSHTLCEYISVAIETKQMLADQKTLLQSFIEVMAGAIDTKSPYTGSHCQRVPVLTEMLTRAVENETDGTFSEFHLTNQQWQELHLAAWLHDCGKVTTPEYVIDKSVKLETVYNRIHEIRTRFEVLKRDVHIEALENALRSKNYVIDMHSLKSTWEKIDDDFAFIANINLGSEYLDQDSKDRLHEISKRTWTKTIDEKQGLSWVELSRYSQNRTQIGVSEPVFSDRTCHLVPLSRKINKDSRFNLTPPQYQNNLGELYNLSISKGTLNNEERFMINNHIVETIKMLEGLPFPKGMKDVPMIAGGHHEKINGEGYPMGLKGKEIPITARVIAIADVFEALTSSDRPYKQVKTLSESIRIMSLMAKEQHIDGALFKLFLESGVYLQFARQYLNPDQIDDVDISHYFKNDDI
ncbi:HD domain-containing phosphohydrolase [Vibrio hyugaensis]|uniref:HD domain-containing phosphohydrolase n=1 Tax=Vibrio hyugaensis TaxID=1534743 RepID=UPI003DA0AE3B